MKTQTHIRGITLLLAVLILSSVLSIALGIFYIILVELQINQNARESYKALYSALSGLECVQYYNKYADPGGNVTKSYWDPEQPCFGNCDTTQVQCAGKAITVASSVVSCAPDDVDCVKAVDYDFDLFSPADPLKPQIISHIHVHAVHIHNDIDPKGVVDGLKIVIESLGKNDSTSHPVNRSLKFCTAPGHLSDPSHPYCQAEVQP